jgi:hypothetical protein
VRWLLGVALVPGCIGLLPFRNEPPRLLSANGVDVPRFRDFVSLPDALDGDTLELTLEVEDPERDKVRIWFPYVEGDFEFDPDGTTGTFHVPGWATSYQLTVILEDDHDPPARAGWNLEIGLPYVDTGGSGLP